MDWQFEEDNPLTRGFEHLHIPVDDVEDENLIRWFPQSNAFIDKALKAKTPQRSNSTTDSRSVHDETTQSENGPGVFIHCYSPYCIPAMGIEAAESATITKSDDMVPIPSKPLSVVEALMLLRQGRPIVEPNPGFMDQLHMYVDMGCPTSSEELERHKLYRRFINRRNVAESLAINRAPDVVDIRFEDDEEVEVEDASARLKSINLNGHLQDDRPREQHDHATSLSPLPSHTGFYSTHDGAYTAKERSGVDAMRAHFSTSFELDARDASRGSTRRSTVMSEQQVWYQCW
ncbi:uncharacterized protein AB675_9725 [Cyphellophora attinorum]|uniref:protein-tyrosine-phosphatase n=1 Tax=Cyphellophora attinorum TaxID=1664694 RepID=A0A0N1NZV9_9EURO|nr:uncharacterized protein AB675_9725 [Phialophora attinorum]KPI42567.1 hypothetical protein AB675_9725 [Phialophora attinorum]